MIILQSCKWGEALKILKFCVTRSSSLTVPPTSMTSSTYNEMSLTSLSGHTSFAEADVSFKKELPGRDIMFSNITTVITIASTPNILNCFKDYKRCIHILNYILDLASPKYLKLSLE